MNSYVVEWMLHFTAVTHQSDTHMAETTRINRSNSQKQHEALPPRHRLPQRLLRRVVELVALEVGALLKLFAPKLTNYLIVYV